MSVVDTVEILKGSDLNDEEYFKAALLGWCIELVSYIRVHDKLSGLVDTWCCYSDQLQAYFLVADDMMDQSITRRGQPCWYRVVSSLIYILNKPMSQAQPSFFPAGV
jgi:farnesyl diphosphate synthase